MSGLQGDLTAWEPWHYVIITGGDDLTRLFSLYVCVWVSNDDLLSHRSVINELMVIKLSLSWDLWDDGAEICSLVVPLAPAVTEDFDVEVKASEETVRAGQPFNVTCVSPTGLGFQQQWLHPKKQARCNPFPVCVCLNFSSVSSVVSSMISFSFPAYLPCFLQPMVVFPCHSLPSSTEP